VADAIFISYRRDDSEGEAGRLFDDLVRYFGNDAVFMDVAGIKPGVDFRQAIEDNVASCGVFLAVVGPTWISIENSDGKRRLEDPNDFVALEVASALKREVPVIPVLVHDAKMPAVDLLPESLKSFAYHNSVELSHARWNSDVALLIEALKAYVTPRNPSEAPVHATVPVQLPAPHPPSGTAAPVEAKSKAPIVAGTSIAAVLVIAAILFFATRPKTVPAPVPTPTPIPAPIPNPVSSPVSNPVSSPDSNQTPVANPAPNPAPPSRTIAHPSVASSPAAEFSGTWKRTGGAGDGDALGLLVISNSGSSIKIHAYGRCQTPVCDWGAQPGVIHAGSVVATFSPVPNGSDTSRTARVTARPVSGGLDVLVQNTFENPAGQRRNTSHHLFVNAQ